MLPDSINPTSVTKRKADAISHDNSIDIVEPTAQRQRSNSTATATTMSTVLDIMTPMTPSSIRPTSSHSHKMSDDDMEDEQSPGMSGTA